MKTCLTLVVLMAVFVVSDAWWFGKRDLNGDEPPTTVKTALIALCRQYGQTTSTEPMAEDVKHVCKVVKEAAQARAQSRDYPGPY